MFAAKLITFNPNIPYKPNSPTANNPNHPFTKPLNTLLLAVYSLENCQANKNNIITRAIEKFVIIYT